MKQWWECPSCKRVYVSAIVIKGVACPCVTKKVEMKLLPGEPVAATPSPARRIRRVKR